MLMWVRNAYRIFMGKPFGKWLLETKKEVER
jgi:hypothetical protein